MIDNEQLQTFCDKLGDDLLNTSLTDEEIDRRLFDIQSDLGLLEQMLKLPSPSKLHKLMTLRTILRDLFGVRGEAFTISKDG